MIPINRTPKYNIMISFLFLIRNKVNVLYTLISIVMLCTQALSHSSNNHHQNLSESASSASPPSISTSPSESSNVTKKMKDVIDLQYPYVRRSPTETLSDIANSASELLLDHEGIDVYGDFDKSLEESYLRRFEREVCTLFGKEDAVFMPSGVMAQSIALKIHSEKSKCTKFACHETSHLLLWEDEGYRHLLGMDAIAIRTSNYDVDGIHVNPLRYCDITRVLQNEIQISTLILELPHRELGGKLTPWDDVIEMSSFCQRNDVAFHCDGARIFESAAGYNKTLEEVAGPFDSVYISFYKGIGAITGAMLLGEKRFCDDARIWLNRFGGNLYTLLPYAISCWHNFRKNAGNDNSSISFTEKKRKMQHIVSLLRNEISISDIVTFDPEFPQTSMVHCYILDASVAQCEKARNTAEDESGIKVFNRIRSITDKICRSDLTPNSGSYFEWSIGQGNCPISDDEIVRGWKCFTRALREIQKLPQE